MADLSRHDQQQPSLAIFALKEKRADIAGTISELQRQVAKHRANLVHIDYTIRLIDPTFTVMDTRKRRVRVSTIGYFEKGELTQRIYAELRRSESVSAAELADAAMADKKLNDPRTRSYCVTRFLSWLGQMAREERSVRVRVGISTYNVRWKLAD